MRPKALAVSVVLAMAGFAATPTAQALTSYGATPQPKRNLLTRTERIKRRIDYFTPYGRWAIPNYIVACESGGSWSAYNPSGAVGPYQLLGWGAPFPATSLRAKLENHRIAYRLWDHGAGAGNWVCT